ITPENGVPFTVSLVEGLGADAYVHGTVPLRDGATTDITVRTDGRRQPTVGATIALAVDKRRIHAFDPQSGLRLGS
ncbi:MAG: TOBE domain-containing protein, partial [Candidatus Nanopelagicales bacterium]